MNDSFADGVKNMNYLLSFILIIFAHLAHAALPVSVGVIEFADENTLFVADADDGRIFAYDLPDIERSTDSASYNLLGFGQSVANQFGVEERDINFHDIATHPANGEIWVSMTISQQDENRPVIVRVNHDGQITQVDLGELNETSVTINDSANDGVKFWRDIPATSLAITDP